MSSLVDLAMVSQMEEMERLLKTAHQRLVKLRGNVEAGEIYEDLVYIDLRVRSAQDLARQACVWERNATFMERYFRTEQGREEEKRAIQQAEELNKKMREGGVK